MTQCSPPPKYASGAMSLVSNQIKTVVEEFLHLSVIDRWPATLKRASTALRRFLVIGE